MRTSVIVPRRMATRGRALPIVALLWPLAACATLKIDTTTRVDDVRGFPTAAQRERLHERLTSRLTAVNAAFASGDKVAHARETLALLLYTRSIPIFYLDAHLPALLTRLEADGVEPHLSFYLDHGRRLSCLGTTDAGWKLARLAERFPKTPPAAFDRQAVFLRKSCSVKSELRAYTDNVGWATAALFYSEFGRNVTRHLAPDLPRLFETIQVADSCGSCGADGAIAVGGAPGAGLRAAEGSDPRTSCSVVGAGLAAGMDAATESTFCRATRDVGGHGFGGAAMAACLKLSQDLTAAAGFPPVQDSIESFQRFEAFIACKGREFEPRRPSPFYRDISTYFDGSADLEEKYGEKIWEEDGRTLRRKALDPGIPSEFNGVEVEYESGNPENVYSKETHHSFDGAGDAQGFGSSTHDYEHGEMRDTEVLHTPDGDYRRDTVQNKDGKTTTYEKDGKEITEAEYNAAKEKHFPAPPPNVDPSPDDPRSPCDRILTERNTPPIPRPDNGPLVQWGPDHVLVKLFEPLRQCMASFDSMRQCSTLLRCAEDPATDRCACRSYSPGSPARSPQCPYIQCEGDAAISNCMCVRADGGIIPGRGGPLFSLPPLPKLDPRRPGAPHWP